MQRGGPKIVEELNEKNVILKRGINGESEKL